MRELEGPSRLQRALLHTAIRLLRPGGTLVYSTCTLNPDECEANVAFALDLCRQLVLVPPKLRLGGPGRRGAGLSDEELR